MRSLQDGQNHLLAPVNSSGPNLLLMDSGTEEVKGRVIISIFSSRMLQQKQTLQVNDAWRVDEIMLSATEICLSTRQSQFVKCQERLVDY